jgi:hypothetical protein
VIAGGIAGVAGAIVMGALMIAMNEAVIAVAIPSLYTLAPPPSVPVGMAVHVFHGAMLGLAFAVLVGIVGIDSDATVVGLGIAWGVLIWIGLAALLMPVWLGAVGSPASPPVPNFALPSLLWHAVYGFVLGVGYVVATDDS